MHALNKIFYCLILVLFLTYASQTFSETMINEQYRIQPNFLDRINLRLPGTGSPSTRQPESLLDEDQTPTTRYTVEIGFPYAQNQLPYIAALTTDLISFGNLIPGEPIKRTLQYQIKANSLAGYTMYIQENQALTSKNANIINDTKCDTGQCTQDIADEWKNPLTYGYGYRCDTLKGLGCSQDFANSRQAFKQFPSALEKEDPVSAINSYLLGTNYYYQITYKINISPNQTGFEYQNISKYILLSYY